MMDDKTRQIAYWYGTISEEKRAAILSALSESQRRQAFEYGLTVIWARLPQYAKDLVTDEWHAVRLPSYSEIERRYPLLIQSMKQAAILTTTEALDCIRALKENRGSGEAVSHFGGPLEVFKAALRCRRWAYEVHRYHRDREKVTA